MRVNCYITPRREFKTRRLMSAFARGCDGVVLSASRPDDADLHVPWGQLWTSLDLIPWARTRGQDVLHLDNGWVDSAHGTQHGYYRATFNGPTPRMFDNLEPGRADRIGFSAQDWRRRGSHVLVCVPGPNFGAAWGITLGEWTDTIVARLQAKTDRPIFVRDKRSSTPLDRDLRGAHCVVTHSSGVAVEAALLGVPVFCEPTCAAAPVGRTDLEIEDPAMPDRTAWMESLAHQQFTLEEMARGKAWSILRELFPEIGNKPSNVRAA
jgi:hypothetical protein